MSAAPHAHDHAGPHKPGAHDHHHDFDPEPTRVLPPDEPRTPLWVPLLGLALFAVAGTWALLFSGDSSEGAASQKSETTKAVPADLPVQPVTPPPQLRVPAPGAAPSVPSVQRLSPEQAKALQERLEQMRNQGTLPQPQPLPGQPQPRAPGQ